MAQYVVGMQTEKQEKFYFIREKESMNIVLLPSKYLMHKKRSKISPNTIRRSAFALSYYLNYMDENQLHLDDIYQMKYAEQHEHFTEFLIWLKAGEHLYFYGTGKRPVREPESVIGRTDDCAKLDRCQKGAESEEFSRLSEGKRTSGKNH